MDYKFKNPIQDYKAEQKFIRKFLLIFLFFDLLMVGVVAMPIIIEDHVKTTETERIIMIVFFIIIIAVLYYCKRFILRKKKLFMRLKHYSGMLQGMLFARKGLYSTGPIGGGVRFAIFFTTFPFFFILIYIEAASNLRKLIKGKITEEELVMQSIKSLTISLEDANKGFKGRLDEEKTNYYLHEEE